MPKNTKAMVSESSLSRGVETVFRFSIIVSGLLLASSSAFAQTGDLGEASAKCWKAWVEFRMKEVPKAEDTVSPATGRAMSQTDGAKRTRALKYQAKLDELELRGKDDPTWKTYLQGCAKL